jgi:hypothetical protein
MESILVPLLATGMTYREAVRTLLPILDDWRALLDPLADAFATDPIGACQWLWETIRPGILAHNYRGASWDRARFVAAAQERGEALRALGIHPLCAILAAESGREAGHVARAILGHRDPWAKAIQDADTRWGACAGRPLLVLDDPSVTAWPEGFSALPCPHAWVDRTGIERLDQALTFAHSLRLVGHRQLRELKGAIRPSPSAEGTTWTLPGATGRDTLVYLRQNAALERVDGLANLKAGLLSLEGCASLRALPAGLCLGTLELKGCANLDRLPDDIQAAVLKRSAHIGGAKATHPLPLGVLEVR